MAKRKKKSKGNQKVVFRRVRGRIVPIKVGPKTEIGIALAGAAGLGAVSGYLASPKKTEKAILNLGGRLLFKPPKGSKKQLFSFASLPKGIQKIIKSGQKSAKITEASKARKILRLSSSAPKLFKKASPKFLLAGGILGAATAFGASKNLIRDSRGDSEIGKTVKDVARVGVGLSALTAANFGFLKATGRKRALAGAIRNTPVFVRRLTKFREFRGTAKSAF